jgi:hypothetical protein
MICFPNQILILSRNASSPLLARSYRSGRSETRFIARAGFTEGTEITIVGHEFSDKADPEEPALIGIVS